MIRSLLASLVLAYAPFAYAANVNFSQFTTDSSITGVEYLVGYQSASAGGERKFLASDFRTFVLATGEAEVYGVGWDGDTSVPQKNDIYDAIEGLDTVYLGLTAQADDVDPAGTAIAAALEATRRQTIRAIGNASTAQTISWVDYDTVTLDLNAASCELTFAEGDQLAAGQERTIAVVASMDGTGNRQLTYAGVTLNLTPQLNPRANAVTTLYFTTRNQGANAEVIGPEPIVISLPVIAPNDLADSVRDRCFGIPNTWGRTIYLTSWTANSDTDDTTLSVFKTEADGSSSVTMDAVEIATNGTSLFTGTDSTITAGTWESGELIWIDYDNTDTPGRVVWTGTFWP